MSRDRHNSAGAIFHQYKIGQVDRHAGLGQGIDTIGAGKNSLFFKILGSTFNAIGFFNFLDKGIYLILFISNSKFKSQRMLRSQ